MVKLREINDTPCKLFYIQNKNTFIEVGTVETILQWNDVRIQIKTEN